MAEEKIVQQVVIALGSNLGDKKSNIQQAVSLIEKKIGKVEKVSSFFENPAAGFESENDFVNACLICESELSSLDLLIQLKEIESQMGRIKTKTTYEDRVIDLDIIFYGNQKIEFENLIIPHPKYTERDFVLLPISELINYQDPITFLLTKQLSE
ncbi:MAG: 2-amino-4-hydroxy-6-hydroxymethyldihydropteridine diphosphokinase, partial [Crocinitomicaceae bacterium]|nr:2-amino-4-hydroxy-6-hydroxymethyldihydropteridine diphosphokinase [Crocinitomicaceae bacterium]